MARPTSWRRFPFAYADLANSPQNIFRLPLGSIDEGDTIGRTLITWQTMHGATDLPGHGSGFLWIAGVITVPTGTAEIDVPLPHTDPVADWIIWDSAVMEPIFQGDDGTVWNEIDCAPQIPRQVQSKGMRLAPAGGLDVWFCAEDDGISPTQSEAYLSFTAEYIIILAA